jgi:eukaryotic-like serine/threonine-protein kinase
MTGRTISHYRILEKLGEGGMGVVYQAVDIDLDRPVAIKFLPPDLSRDKESVARFINEAKVASRLQHENICTIHEISQAEVGEFAILRLFIVMDYYEGSTLKDVLTRRPGGLPPTEAIDIVAQATRGVQAAHDSGIIHRDIKPSNIIITRDGRVKILDFGLARSIEHSGITRVGQTPGTLAYMSPEQATGGKVDLRTDIWSLGVLLYELISGKRPFGADVGPSLVYHITKEQPRRLSDVVPGIPGMLDRVARRALEKDPTKRYAAAGEMLRDLLAIKERFAGGGDSRFRNLMRKLRGPFTAVAQGPSAGEGGVVRGGR